MALRAPPPPARRGAGPFGAGPAPPLWASPPLRGPYLPLGPAAACFGSPPLADHHRVGIIIGLGSSS
eukprot:614034-Prymnesium_polylepis.1